MRLTMPQQLRHWAPDSVRSGSLTAGQPRGTARCAPGRSVSPGPCTAASGSRPPNSLQTTSARRPGGRQREFRRRPRAQSAPADARLPRARRALWVCRRARARSRGSGSATFQPSRSSRRPHRPRLTGAGMVDVPPCERLSRHFDEFAHSLVIESRKSGSQGTNRCQGTDQGTVQGSQEALKEGLPKSNISPFSESVRGYL